MAPQKDSEEVNVMTPTAAPAASHILHLLPHLSDLPLAYKWKTMLESQMEDIPGTATPPNKALSLFGTYQSSWEEVSAEDRSEVAAVLATGGLLLPSLGQGEEYGWSHFLFCFFMALLPSLPNLHRLRLGPKFPGRRIQEMEEALELFYAAFLTTTTTSIQQLLLVGNPAYGRGKSCWHLAQLLRSSHAHFHSLRSLDADGARGLSSNITRFTKQPVIEDSHMGGDSATMPRTNCPLQELRLRDIDMGEDGLAHLCDGLSQSTASSSLNTLTIYSNKGIGEQGALHLGNMLAHNLPLLRKLLVARCNLQDEEGHLARGLQENTSLEELDISDNNLGKRGLELLFRCLEGSNNKNSLKALTIDLSSKKLPLAQDLAAMIVSNSSLQRLDVSDFFRVSKDYDFYSSQDWATHILPAVARNKVLQSLNIAGCQGVDGKAVRTALLELLRVNTTLQELNLDTTPLVESGKAAAVYEMLRRNKKYGKILDTMPKSKPRSCRIILCGKEYAGKSTLLNTLRLVYKRGQGIHYYYQHIKARGHRLWRSAFLPSDNDRQLSERTRGIHIHLLKDDDAPNGRRVSAWDFAGQREYHALHHLMFPSGSQGAATIFVYTFNPIQIPGHPKAGQVLGGQDLREDFSYWLKFVASNSRPDAPPPQVVVVITSKDKLARRHSETQTMIAQEYQPVITALAHQFSGAVNVRSEPAFAVNALDANDADINGWVEWMEGSFQTTLTGLPEVPSICDKVAKAAQKSVTPIVTIEDFVFTCKETAQDRDVSLLLDRGEWKAVAAYLHDAGEVIYHDNSEFPFIVLNPRWFGQGILAYLLDLFQQDLPRACGWLRNTFTCCSKQGGDNNQRSATGKEYFSKKDLGGLLKAALKNVPGLNSTTSVKEEHLIQLMLLLNLCYQKPLEDASGKKEIVYFIPAIFQNPEATLDRRPLKWRQIPGPSFIFAGRRLESDDCKRTVLTDGFFPLVQVVLQNNSVRDWPGSDICILEKNLFTIMVNGIEVMVEYSSFRYSVDVLVMSSKSHQETMKFVESHFIQVIREVCASQEGCPGVSLREAIIRPACCGAGGKHPVLCAYRKDEQVITVDELKRRIREDSNYHHSWAAVKDERGLVKEAAASDSASRLLGEASDPSTARGSSVMTSDDPDWHGQHIFVETKDVPILHKAVAGIQFSTVVPLRLQLQCGCRQGGHKVEQQPGRTFYLVNNATRYALEQNIRQGLVLFVASALTVTPGLSGAGSALSSLDLKDGTPIYRDTIESLSERVWGKVAGEVGREDLRFVVEDDMRKGRSGDWMTDFLYGDSSKVARDAFRRDFKLTKVKYNISSSAHASAWICDEHYKEDSEMCTRS